MDKCAIYIKLESILGDILTINIEITYVYIVASSRKKVFSKDVIN